jgi:hypothetical protein
LNVTRFVEGLAAAVRAATRASLGSASSDIELMKLLLQTKGCHATDMIAPTADRCKRARTRRFVDGPIRADRNESKPSRDR